MNTTTQTAELPLVYKSCRNSKLEIARTPRRNILWKFKSALKYILPYPLKIVNYIGLQYSMIIGKFDHHFYPVILGMEVTGRCNLRCPLCPRTAQDRRPQGDMKWEDFKMIIDKLSPYLFSVRLHNYGEPMLHPLLPQMIEYVHKKGVYTNFHTNGHFLTTKNIESLLNSGLDEINIALDGMSQSTYSYYRVEGDFERVRSGVVLLCNSKKEKKLKRPRVNLQFLVMAHNEHEIPDIISFASSVGVDRLYLKPVNINTGKDSGNISYLPKDNTFNQYLTNEYKMSKKCRRTFMETIINWDGSISICTSDHSSDYFVRGSVFYNEIDNVLFGSEFIKVKEKSYNRGLEPCKVCVDSECQI